MSRFLVFFLQLGITLEIWPYPLLTLCYKFCLDIQFKYSCDYVLKGWTWINLREASISSLSPLLGLGG